MNTIIQLLLHYDIFIKKFLEYISKEENDSKINVSKLKEIYNTMLKEYSKKKELYRYI